MPRGSFSGPKITKFEFRSLEVVIFTIMNIPTNFYDDRIIICIMYYYLLCESKSWCRDALFVVPKWPNINSNLWRWLFLPSWTSQPIFMIRLLTVLCTIICESKTYCREALLVVQKGPNLNSDLWKWLFLP